MLSPCSQPCSLSVLPGQRASRVTQIQSSHTFCTVCQGNIGVTLESTDQAKQTHSKAGCLLPVVHQGGTGFAELKNLDAYQRCSY